MIVGAKTVTMPLPHGRDFLWFADLNILALAPHLDDTGRQNAVHQAAAEWSREMCRSVRRTRTPRSLPLAIRRQQPSSSAV